MARLKPMFRVFAVVNALLLFGLYVCYRGGVVQAFGSKVPEQPVQGDPPPRPQASTDVQPVDPKPAPVASAETQRTELLPGPKAAFPGIIPERKPAPEARTEIANMSMSAAINTSPARLNEELAASNDIVTIAKPVAKPSADAQKEVRKDTVDHAQTAAVPAAPEKKKKWVIMGGPKSGKIMLVDDDEPPAAIPQLPVQKAVQQVTRKVIMMGSKSAPVEIDPKGRN